MNKNIEATYKYFIRRKCNTEDAKLAFSFIDTHCCKKGKILCWHDWKQFEVIPNGWIIGIDGIKIRCSKCGNKKKSHYFPESRCKFIDYSRYVRYE